MICYYLHLPHKDLNKPTYFCETNSGLVVSRFAVRSHELVKYTTHGLFDRRLSMYYLMNILYKKLPMKKKHNL